MLNMYKASATPSPHTIASRTYKPVHVLSNVLLLPVGTPAWNLIDFRASLHKLAAELTAEWKGKGTQTSQVESSIN